MPIRNVLDAGDYKTSETLVSPNDWTSTETQNDQVPLLCLQGSFKIYIGNAFNWH